MLIKNRVSPFLKAPLNKLNQPLDFDNDLVNEKNITHKIVNLMNLTEVDKSNFS